MKNNLQYIKNFLLLVCILPITACGQKKTTLLNNKIFKEMNAAKTTNSQDGTIDTATFAAGCFWCVEAQFGTLKGVQKVISGFTGGHTPNPTYQTVSTGTTGYAEACNIIYNPKIISYPELLAAFFIAHDPTQLNRQGNDIGTQYRSAIFYHDNNQKKLAQYYINQLNTAKAYPKQIVTEVTPYTHFYPADKHHQNYFKNNPKQPYCQYVIQPEMKKFKKIFKNKLKQQ